MQVNGKAKIFKNEYNGNTYYTTSIANKKEDGTYENMYLAVQFKKGMEVDGDINIINGFLTFYKDKNNVPKVKVVILEYTQEDADFITIEETDDLPF